MTAHELCPCEWHDRLRDTPLGPYVHALPADARVVVVEGARGEIVGTWVVARYVHVEGLWIAPTHQKKAAVGRRLLGEVRRIAAQWGVRGVITGAVDDQVVALIQKYGGTRVPGVAYALPLEGR